MLTNDKPSTLLERGEPQGLVLLNSKFLWGNMGQAMSRDERNVFELMPELLQQHGRYLPSNQLKILLKWTSVELLGVSRTTIFTTDLWDEMGVKLWSAVTKGNKAAANVIPSWMVIFETLKAQEKSQAQNKGDAPTPSATDAQGSSQSEETGETAPSLSAQPRHPLSQAPPRPTIRVKGFSQAIGAFSTGYSPEDSEEGEEDPFDHATVDPDHETNLFPPDPHENWVHLKQEALIQGDLDIAENIVTPAIYSGM
ncbi:hypothetical protein TURU_015418 [Turdus rufiventris]|nr:hypothetical protein TURU_015418 [Turdus rufiventris]